MATIGQDERDRIRKSLNESRVELPDGTRVPRLGQGTWNMGDNPAAAQEEIRTLRLGVELGMNLIDTAEMYGEGLSESLVGEAIEGIRDEVFLVSKVYPHNAGRGRIARSCEDSLRRLKTDRLDLYLLHWRGSVPLGETIEGMEKLVKEGKILRWGVSNLDQADMEELLGLPGGTRCATDQVLYHLGSRGIEYDLLPWMREHRLPAMAYSPLAQAGSLRKGLVTHPAVREIADRHGVSPFSVMLAWCIRGGDVIAIPKASTERHVLENARAAALSLTEEEQRKLDEAFPPPTRKKPLDII
ncbi:aldo/keto reductase [Paenibacillus aurantius]|uniref:Aldo/keto reductase n=1 Tax=Paenibacillus aurantius TaxID=2918900 RepID=A0AA96LHS1_9BACL|nr:aldo/keto reductase [Paenibacillus aurantius]WNQ12241.1 aldo/keto reductase [Paenibacillus aurantius]